MNGSSDQARRRELSGFLKSRRAKLRPQDVGFPAAGPRRAPGLRREEVAALAGISVNWYTLLETGRNDTISSHALLSVARALRLDHDERLYLAALARVPISPDDLRERLPPASLRNLIDNVHHTPTVIWNRRRDALAWNALFGKIFDYAHEPSDNSWHNNGIWRIFNDPSRRRFWIDWPAAARRAVAALRWQFSHEPELVNELIEALRNGPEFDRFWTEVDGIADWMHDPQAQLSIAIADERVLRFCSVTLAPPESGVYLVQFYTPADDATVRIASDLEQNT